MANFSPVDRDEIQETQSCKMVKRKLDLFAAAIALWTLVALLIKLIRILLKWKCIQHRKLCHFGCYVGKAKLFRLKSFVSVTRAGVFIWENFHPGYRDPRSRYLGQPGFSYTETHRNFYEGKSDEAKSRKLSQPG